MNKATFTFSTLMILISVTAFGQNFQTIQSNEIHYFSTQNHDYFLASRTESVEMEGLDSVFFTYQTLREDEALPEGDPCKYYLGAAWSGQKTIVKPDGANVYFNKDNEPITIQTQAVEGDTFEVYSYPSGDWIKGVVVNELSIFILDDYDNIKIIELFSNVPFNFSDNRIIISENHGFVETFAFYSFPQPYEGVATVAGQNGFPQDYDGNFELVGIDTTGFHKPTTYDIFNFEIGDEFKFQSSATFEDGAVHDKYEEKKVINKFLWPNDSVMYFIEKSGQSTVYSPSGTAQTEVNEGELTSVVFTNLNSWNTPYLPEEFNGTDGWSLLRINDCGDVEEVSKKHSMYWDGQSPCVQVAVEGDDLRFTAIKGVGWIGKEGQTGEGEEFTAELVYYDKVLNGSCGTNQYLTLEDDEDFVGNSVYPNPSNGEVSIQIGNSDEESEITIFDKSGQIVQVWRGSETVVALDLENISPGMYIVQVENENGMWQEKLVMN